LIWLPKSFLRGHSEISVDGVIRHVIGAPAPELTVIVKTEPSFPTARVLTATFSDNLAIVISAALSLSVERLAFPKKP
jgi:hypothetical protein